MSAHVAFSEEQPKGMHVIISHPEVSTRTELESLDCALGILGGAIVVSILGASIYLSFRYLL